MKCNPLIGNTEGIAQATADLLVQQLVMAVNRHILFGFSSFS
jgi:hypothetical protein